MTASPDAIGQHTGVLTARDMHYGRFLKGSPRHRMSLNTDTGRVHLFYPARKQPDGDDRALYCSAFSLVRSAQAERDYESCFFVCAAAFIDFVRRYHAVAALGVGDVGDRRRPRA
ncbi:hypothetical protein EVAR_44423_1 [Eumeta japonica]|uniref:Uncharacterized protein n=1 Tax=Eumeta variegata TaxID=151549 RepID=A0A4C1XU96_EUMVA|nr:hypothetical protein EVAR_44423_1 [Eumeta japonica]